jgi:ADP-dependent NAD(P)H-hydrate dehydratase
MPGAAILSATAALRAGAGKVRIATHEAAAMVVGAGMPEAYVIAMPGEKRGRRLAVRAILESARSAAAILLGPGVDDTGMLNEILHELLRDEEVTGTVILDAFTLPLAAECLPQRGPSKASFILTPHQGEMARMLDVTAEEVAQNPVATVREAAEEMRAVVALKGARTHISAPGEGVYLNERGHPGLGTAGSGDVLAGLVAGLCGRGADALTATLWGVHLHAVAGEALAQSVGPTGFLAREILDEIPRQMKAAQARPAKR